MAMNVGGKKGAMSDINITPYIDILLVLLTRRRCERRFDRLENDFAIDTLLVGDGIRD